MKIQRISKFILNCHIYKVTKPHSRNIISNLITMNSKLTFSSMMKMATWTDNPLRHKDFLSENQEVHCTSVDKLVGAHDNTHQFHMPSLHVHLFQYPRCDRSLSHTAFLRQDDF